MWRVDHRSGPSWLKIATQRRKYTQERDAYAQWVPWLAEQGHHVPTCLATDDHLMAIALSHVEGERFAVPHPRLFEQAGRFLRDVHAAPFPSEDPMSVADAVRMRAERWCGNARGLVDDRIVDHTLARCTEPGVFDDLNRTVCHRDFSPRNWLVRDDGTLAFIDFEHSMHEIWLAEFQRLEDWELRWWPQVRDAFYRGFGRRFTARERDQLLRLRWLYATATVAWAIRHGDPVFEAQGREALDRLSSTRGGVAGCS